MPERPGNRETGNENLRPAGDGKAPRPATEPAGSKGALPPLHGEGQVRAADQGGARGGRFRRRGRIAACPTRLVSLRSPIHPPHKGEGEPAPASLNAAPVFLALT